MLFKAEWVQAVLRGQKRQTIRLKPPRVRVGRTYAVQTSFRGRAQGRIRVTEVRRCTLRGLTPHDLQLEGWAGRSRPEFERYFAAINHFDPDTMPARDWAALRSRSLWCIEFEPVEASGDP